MTLAIAAEYPWGHWRDGLRGAKFAGAAIILAADTRWSYSNGQVRDEGRKLWTLGTQTGLVLAGDVWAGEEGIRKLFEVGKDEKFSNATEVANLAADVFRNTYRTHLKEADAQRRPPCGPLYYLMGLVDRDRNTALVRLSSEAEFHPLFLEGVHAIGVPSAREIARDYLLRRMMNETNFGKNRAVDPAPAALAVAGAIDEVIGSRAESSVGGWIQLVIGDDDGWREIGMSVLESGADAEVNDNWTERSRPLSELITAQASGLTRLASCEADDLGVEQIG